MPVQVQAGKVHDFGRSKLAKTKDLLSAIETPNNLYTLASVGLPALHDLGEDHPVGGPRQLEKHLPQDLVWCEVHGLPRAECEL